jgi:ceramide glucosyltransferase
VVGVLTVLGILAYALAGGYLFLATFALLGGARTLRPPSLSLSEGVSVLVPLHGSFAGLERCLESLFRQDHPCYELLFGTCDPEDSALATLEEAARRHPKTPVRVFITPPPPVGTNPKVVNLEALEPHAQHNLLVLIDADIVLETEHLRRVTAALHDPATGLVTCPYGVEMPARANLWQKLAALYIGDWFYTSVLIGSLVAPEEHGFGATLALRRSTLAAAGGLAALRHVLADDHVLPARVRALGLRTGILESGVKTVVNETTFRTLWAHEKRWLGTIRALDPWGYLGLPVGLTSVPLLLGVVLLGGGAVAWGGFLILAAGRLVLHFLAWNRSRSGRLGAAVLLLPARDFLTLAEWLAALGARRLVWSGSPLTIDGRGQLEDNDP